MVEFNFSGVFRLLYVGTVKLATSKRMAGMTYSQQILRIATCLLFILAPIQVMAASQLGSNSSNVSIPDNNANWSASSSIFISGAPAGAVITGIDIHIEIIHPYVGDLEVVLTDNDANPSVRFWNREGGSQNNINQTWTNISNYNGQAVNQTWTLWARDLAALDTGYIDYWWITIYYSVAVNLPAPTLSTPPNGSTNQSTTPSFSWTTLTDATSYRLMVATSQAALPRNVDASTCADCVINTTPSGPSYTPSAGVLSPGTTYWWQVKGRNATQFGEWSSQFSFTTAAANLPAPTLSNPPNGSTDQATTPTFSWTTVTDATSYRLMVATSQAALPRNVDASTCADCVINTTPSTASYVPGPAILQPSTTYWWQVKGRNTTQFGEWSSQFSFTTAANGGTFYLSFPLPNRDATTAKINSVFDHSMINPYTADEVVIAYTGEVGQSQYGQDYVTTINGNALYGFKNSSGTSFTVNGNYAGAGHPTYLYYDGHPGIDYRTTDQSANGQINVLAAADGIAHWVSGSVYNTIYIDHGNGYATRYLHLSQRIVSDLATVVRGQVIGISGDAGVPGSPHLHFEVHLNGVPADPYGWQGSGSDPYTRAVNVNLWNPSPLLCNYSISPLGRSHGSGAEVGSFDVHTSDGCDWAATTSNSWITITSGNSGSGNGSVSYSLLANSGSSPRTRTITIQGQTFTIIQAGLNTPIGYPGATWMGPAAAGNYEADRGGNSIDKVIIHTTEGSAASAVDRFQTAGEGVSAHYIISTNGAIWQVVADSDTAYHCGNYTYNQQSIGIELEGWSDGNPAGDFSWQTDAHYTALQNLISWLRTQYNIPLDRAHIIGHNQVPSPGGIGYPPTTQWGGASNHYDPGAWWNWRRLMAALGHMPAFTMLRVQSPTSITTLPQAGAPIITPATPGQHFVAYDSFGSYYLVFVSGSELPQQNLPAGGEFHWDGWIPAADVAVETGATQLEVTGVFPGRLNIRNSPSITGSTVLARAIDGKRYVATGNTANADSFTWREFYIATTNNTVATGWAITDNLTVIGSYLLTVAKTGTGSGTVTSSPPGITCGADCTEPYTHGTTVTLTATPASGSTLASWSSNCPNGVVTMDAAKTCIATFNVVLRTLTVAKTGTGSGTVTSSPPGITCGTDCTEAYTHGTTVTLTATPASGSTLASWSSNCPNGVVTMDAAKTCTATFTTAPPQPLTVTKAGTGTGTVTSTPAGITCGADCSEAYAYNTVVVLTPTPALGSAFGGWSGHADCTDGAVRINATKTCTATFSALPVPQVSAGGAHTCGVQADGTVACWGNDSSGQASPPAGAFAQVSAAEYHTCGLRADDTVACWGTQAH